MRPLGSGPRADGLLIVGGSVTLFHGNGVGWAYGQAVPKPVAIVLAQERGLSVDHADRSLMTGAGAKAAAVALFFINMDNLTDHYHLPPLIF
jgi:hypothetical protein